MVAGVGALLLASGKKKTARPRASAPPSPDRSSVSQASPTFTARTPHSVDDPVAGTALPSVLLRHIDPGGRAQLGMLYQVKENDRPLEVCLEAIFGSRHTSNDRMWQAARDLLVRVECGPWNQALYAVPRSVNGSSSGHPGGYFTQFEISFDPIYQNNFDRVESGLSPTSSPGDSYALIWIPMINDDAFDTDFTVTTRGMTYPDTELRQGGNMIDPPDDIIDLGFDEVSFDEVGCQLPDGDFRRRIITD